MLPSGAVRAFCGREPQSTTTPLHRMLGVMTQVPSHSLPVFVSWRMVVSKKTTSTMVMAVA